ncbi:DNA polymerase III subunit delta' [Afifella sp. IM 167]|uniref:DNA polymerase III subunit delta' n=1 Tax=Afifella sp. IM 167 TaxID=2033586 RepID=UPI001CCC2A27|nr:DNA polymerase III subunit delta' [Afifella sp. IM 167]MBZ8132514.1 DNA polymerase III subunit delta' [Afifella sp. IM 167]
MAKKPAAEERPSLDRLPGVPLPQESPFLFGHEEAEQQLLTAYRGNRLHHGLLLSGPVGVGKATLAFRLAKFLLAHPDRAAPDLAEITDLSIPANHALHRRVGEGGHPNVLHLQRPWDDKRKTFKTVISVETIRRIVPFLGTTAGEGAWRIVIVDGAEEMNRSAANALLKGLEEPPQATVFVLVTSRPGQLLPTIRSRCRSFHLGALDEAAIARVFEKVGAEKPSGGDLATVAVLAGGSARRALELASGNGLGLYRAIARAFAATDHASMQAVAEQAAAARGAAWAEFSDLVGGYLDRRVRRLPEPEEGASPPSLPLARWAELWEKVARRSAEVETFNLDRRQFVLNVFETVAEAARHPHRPIFM